MKIDSHHHLWKYTLEEFGWIDPSLTVLRRDFLADEFEAALRSAGYQGSIAVQARQSLAETRFLVETARNHPFIKGVVGWVDLASPDLGQQLDEFEGTRLVGVRHVIQSEPAGFLRRPEIVEGLKEIGRRGLVYDLLVLPHQLAETANAVERLPGILFVLDHLGKPAEGSTGTWRRDIAPLAEHPGVSVKMSGWFSESSPSRWDESEILHLFDTAFDLFGPDRLLAASNWPVSELAGPYGWVMRWGEQFAAQFPEEIQNQILGGNASRIYGLDR